MSLTCFFGQELKPDGTPFTPVMPPKSSLVITQVSVTSAFPTGGAVTLSVQSHKMPSKIAVATLCPDQNIYHCALQLIFSDRVTFFLEAAAGVAEDGEQQRKGAKNFEKHRPHVHISGYYECEDLGGDDDEDDEEESDAEDEFVASRTSKKTASSTSNKKSANDAKKGTKRQRD